MTKNCSIFRLVGQLKKTFLAWPKIIKMSIRFLSIDVSFTHIKMQFNMNTML